MMKLNKLKVAAAVALLVGSANVVAQEEATNDAATPAPLHNENDHEHMQDGAKQHKHMHRKIRQKAYEQRKKRAENQLKELDLNNDEQVDINEYLSHAETRFNSLDADGNGYVTKQEAKERHRELRKKHRMKRKEIRQEIQDEAAPNF